MTPETKLPSESEKHKPIRVFYFHYAWIILILTSVVTVVGGSITNVIGVFIGPMTENFGWSQGTITLAYALSSLVTAISAPSVGSFGDRYGARRSMVLGCILFVIGMALTGLVTKPWQFYITFGIILGVANAIFMVPLLAVPMDWFRRHLGMGIGILMAAKGLGPVFIAPIIGYLIIKYGWLDTCLIISISSGLIMTVMIMWFHNRPIDKGVRPYGSLPDDPVEVPKRPNKLKVQEFASYMKHTAPYWNMSSIHFLGCVGHSVIIVYLVPLAVSENISLVTAASLLAVMSGVSMISRLFTPIFADTIGTKTVMTFAFMVQGLTVIILFWTHDLWLFYMFAILFGIGYGGEAGGFPILNRRYYGHAPTGSALGAQFLGAGLGMALGGWIGGIIYDATSSYNIALILSVAASLGGMVSIVFLESPNKLLIPDWEETNEIGLTPSVSNDPDNAKYSHP